MHFNYTLTLKLAVTEDFRIVPQVHKIMTKVRYFKAFFNTGTNNMILENKVGNLNKLIQAVMNEKLKEGFEIPLIKDKKDIFKEVKIQVYDKYMLMGAFLKN